MRIVQVLDPSHKNWVIGGLFRDLQSSSSFFDHNSIFLPSPNTLLNFIRWMILCKKISSFNFVLFSSLTPLENYSKFRFTNKKASLGLWFTHKDKTFSQKQKIAIKKCDVIFVHSQKIQKLLLQEFPKKKIIIVIGAIDLDRFKLKTEIGTKIVWVGTIADRKNPEIFINLVRLAPHLNFRVHGKKWKDSDLWPHLEALPNIEYFEIDHPLTSTDFNGCSVYLMLSKIEGGPMPLLESLAAGLIPICTRTGFVEDLLVPLGLESNIIDEFELTKIIEKIEVIIHSNIDRTVTSKYVQTFSVERMAKLIFHNLVGDYDKSE
jgi:glycosyltransferase involved in cell wall biosynthesis